MHAEQALDHTVEAVFAESFRVVSVRLLDDVGELSTLHEFQDHVYSPAAVVDFDQADDVAV